MVSMHIKKIAVILTIGLTLLIGTIHTYTPTVYAQHQAYQTLLRQGMRSNAVKNLQLQLQKLKYFNANATNFYGPITTEAVRNFQRDMGLMADGVAGPQTLRALEQMLSQDEVKILQTQLKNLNYFSANVTGYYGPITREAVRAFQRDMGLSADGVVGPKTIAAIQRATPKTSRGAATRSNSTNLMVPWSQADKIFSDGTIATVTDVATGLQYRVKRITGHRHADVETLTAQDTAIMLRTYGGSWSWQRRAVIVNVNGVEMAASIAGMPHAGRDDRPYGVVVDNRSGGFGRGVNLDKIKNNNMSGVVCIHFYQSRTHGGNRLDPAHQEMVRRAASSR